MHDDDTSEAPTVLRHALRGWQQRVQAVIEIARDSDDLAVRLPVLDQLAHELVRDLQRAVAALDAVAQATGARLPPGADVLRDALGKALAHVSGIELWHRAASVSALRKARDGFSLAADRLAPPTADTGPPSHPRE